MRTSTLVRARRSNTKSTENTSTFCWSSNCWRSLDRFEIRTSPREQSINSSLPGLLWSLNCTVISRSRCYRICYVWIVQNAPKGLKLKINKEKSWKHNSPHNCLETIFLDKWKMGTRLSNKFVPRESRFYSTHDNPHETFLRTLKVLRNCSEAQKRGVVPWAKKESKCDADTRRATKVGIDITVTVCSSRAHETKCKTALINKELKMAKDIHQTMLYSLVFRSLASFRLSKAPSNTSLFCAELFIMNRPIGSNFEPKRVDWVLCSSMVMVRTVLVL